MMKQAFERDYTFAEWCALSFENKRIVWNHYWNPFKPEVGKLTRENILAEFRHSYPIIDKTAMAIGFGYFGHYVGCLYVIVSSGNIIVPKGFADLIVNKGVLRKKIDNDTLMVDWRDVGGKNNKFTLKDGDATT